MYQNSMPSILADLYICVHVHLIQLQKKQIFDVFLGFVLGPLWQYQPQMEQTGIISATTQCMGPSTTEEYLSGGSCTKRVLFLIESLKDESTTVNHISKESFLVVNFIHINPQTLSSLCTPLFVWEFSPHSRIFPLNRRSHHNW